MKKKLSCGLLALTFAFNSAPALLGSVYSPIGAVDVFADTVNSYGYKMQLLHNTTSNIDLEGTITDEGDFTFELIPEKNREVSSIEISCNYSQLTLDSDYTYDSTSGVVTIEKESLTGYVSVTVSAKVIATTVTLSDFPTNTSKLEITKSGDSTVQEIISVSDTTVDVDLEPSSYYIAYAYDSSGKVLGRATISTGYSTTATESDFTVFTMNNSDVTQNITAPNGSNLVDVTASKVQFDANNITLFASTATYSDAVDSAGESIGNYVGDLLAKTDTIAKPTLSYIDYSDTSLIDSILAYLPYDGNTPGILQPTLILTSADGNTTYEVVDGFETGSENLEITLTLDNYDSSSTLIYYIHNGDPCKVYVTDNGNGTVTFSTPTIDPIVIIDNSSSSNDDDDTATTTFTIDNFPDTWGDNTKVYLYSETTDMWYGSSEVDSTTGVATFSSDIPEGSYEVLIAVNSSSKTKYNIGGIYVEDDGSATTSAGVDFTTATPEGDSKFPTTNTSGEAVVAQPSSIACPGSYSGYNTVNEVFTFSVDTIAGSTSSSTLVDLTVEVGASSISGERIAVFEAQNGTSSWSEVDSNSITTAGASAMITSGGIIAPAVTAGTGHSKVTFPARAGYSYSIAKVTVSSSSSGGYGSSSSGSSSSGSTSTDGTYNSAGESYTYSGNVMVNGTYINELRGILAGEYVNLDKITVVNGQTVLGWYYDAAFTKAVEDTSAFVFTSEVLSNGLYAKTTGTVSDTLVDGSTNAGAGGVTSGAVSGTTGSGSTSTNAPSSVPATISKILSKLF